MNANLFRQISISTTLAAGAMTFATANADHNSNGTPYEIWGSDQSNSVSGQESRGVNGSFLWIWKSEDMESQLSGDPDATPIGCDAIHPSGKRGPGIGPCDLHDVFPDHLKEINSSQSPTGNTLADLPSFGRLHGMLPDPQNMYMNVNIFAPGGGYVGIIDGATKEAIALFRVTSTSSGRSLHMSFWNSDGSAILLANLHGKILERIDIKRNNNGKIIQATFNQSASLGVGKSMTIVEPATAFRGKNAHGKPLISRVRGAYDETAFSDLTPNGKCKENGCASGPDGDFGGRANNVIVCPIVSDNDNAYITFGGGGLLIADTRATPMQVVGEYDNQIINGAGCGGVQVGDQMWINAGVSASGAGATQSTYTMYKIEDAFGSAANFPNTPSPTLVYKDPTNTATIGNIGGDPSPNNTGQLPGVTTRRDAHGATATLSGSHVHNVDRIQNNVEVFDTVTLARTTYDLTSADGQGAGVGPCLAKSVQDDVSLPLNDPAPDLMDTTPDGKYMVVALRGPVPVSVTHAAQGSCPGVGIIEVLDGGAAGKLVGVLRTENLIDTAPVSAPGGHAYTGAEHSDVHGAAIRARVEDQ